MNDEMRTAAVEKTESEENQRMEEFTVPADTLVTIGGIPFWTKGETCLRGAVGNRALAGDELRPVITEAGRPGEADTSELLRARLREIQERLSVAPVFRVCKVDARGAVAREWKIFRDGRVEWPDDGSDGQAIVVFNNLDLLVAEGVLIQKLQASGVSDN